MKRTSRSILDTDPPVILHRPSKSAAELRAEIAALGPRPSHTDVLALTEWVRDRDWLLYQMILVAA